MTEEGKAKLKAYGIAPPAGKASRRALFGDEVVACPHCGGTGHVRSTESAAIHVLRGIEEEGAKRRAAEIVVYAAPQVALYILNHKRERLADVARQRQCWLLAGVNELASGNRLRNTLLLFDPRGNLVDRYSKMHLVPFGEVVPMRANDFAGPNDAIPGTPSARSAAPRGSSLDAIWRNARMPVADA